MKRFISFVLLFCILMVSTAFASVIEEIPEDAIAVNNGMYIVGENFPSGSYTFCIDLNEPGIKEQIAVNDEIDAVKDRERYKNGHVAVGALMFLYKDYQTMLDDSNGHNGQSFYADGKLDYHIVLIDGMSMRISLYAVSKGYLVPDKID